MFSDKKFPNLFPQEQQDPPEAEMIIRSVFFLYICWFTKIVFKNLVVCGRSYAVFGRLRYKKHQLYNEIIVMLKTCRCFNFDIVLSEAGISF